MRSAVEDAFAWTTWDKDSYRVAVGEGRVWRTDENVAVDPKSNFVCCSQRDRACKDMSLTASRDGSSMIRVDAPSYHKICRKIQMDGMQDC